jgi:uncharacterized protein (TIGR02611 family)
VAQDDEDLAPEHAHVGPGDDDGIDEGRVFGPLDRLRHWSFQGTRARRLFWRTAVLIVGASLLVLGVVMLVFPGPGWAAIILGLVVLASEFAWFNRVLQPVRRLADRAAEAALDPRRRTMNLVIGSVVIVAVAAVAWWYYVTYGLSTDGLTWLPGI